MAIPIRYVLAVLLILVSAFDLSGLLNTSMPGAF